MAFDIKTAKPVKSGFDISTAKPVQEKFGGGKSGGKGASGDFSEPAPFGSYDDPKALMNRMAGGTPEQMAQRGHPNVAAAQKTGQDMITIPAHFLNQLLMNAPRSLVETYSKFKYPETDNPIAKPLSKAAGIAGALKTGGGILSAAPKTLAGRVAAGGLAGAVYSPTENFNDMKQRGMQGAIGAALPVAGAAVSKIPPQVSKIMKTVKNVKNPSVFAKKVRQSMFRKKSDIGKAFGEKVDDLAKAYPEKVIDLSEQFDFIKANVDDIQANPGLRGQIKSAVRKSRNKESVKLINELIDDPQKAQNLNIKQVQDIKTTIQQSPSIARKLQKGKFADYSPAETELLDLLDDIKVAQSEVFPEMAQIRKPYAQYMQSYKRVRNMFKEGSLIGKMKQGFGDDEVNEMIKVVLPKKTFGDINAYRRTLKGIKYGAKGTAAIAGLEGGRRIINRLSGN